MRRLFGLLLFSPALLWAGPAVSLDEVLCATCHFDQGEEFAQSIHYQQGQLLCNDCHGGLPFEADPEKAKAPGTGFIGKPKREDIAALCGKCHAAPARFFVQGPHAAWQNQANPTCISCHTNHRVQDATLALMDSTCTQCHQAGTPALARGSVIRQRLDQASAAHRQLQAQSDSLQAVEGSLRKATPYLEAAASALRETDPLTHTLDLGMIDRKLGEVRGEEDQVRQLISDYYAGRRHRVWAVAGIWVIVVANLFLLWIKRRQLK
ncbi:MAG: hypothetical protein EXS58_11430 [Candidatus Latescibacteria bacterium]|nr:hypothetical protein [Candidatus Latescibacterota bacterium]